MKPYLIIFAIILTGTIAKGQSAFRTNESISSQLINGTAPGLVFRKAAPVTHETKADAGITETSDTQAGKNASPNVVNKTKIAQTNPQTDLPAQTKSAVRLASDRPAEISGPVEKVVPPKSVQ